MLNPDSVVALGGGTLLRDENRSCAESSGEIVCLDADLPYAAAASGRRYQMARPLLEGDLPE